MTSPDDQAQKPDAPAREWKLELGFGGMIARTVGAHIICINEIVHVIEKSAYDSLLREFKALDALRSMDIEQLNALAKRIAELERYEKGYGRWESQQVSELKEELATAKAEIAELSEEKYVGNHSMVTQLTQANQRIAELETLCQSMDVSKKSYDTLRAREQRLVAALREMTDCEDCDGRVDILLKALAYKGGA